MDDLKQDIADVDAVLRQFGMDGRAAQRILPGGHVNEHWRVSGSPAFVLRRYNAKRTTASIAFEHDLLFRLADGGWPVAAPTRRGDAGVGFVEGVGRLWSIFPLLPGVPMPAHDRTHIKRQGRLLASLHRDLAASGAMQQREEFGRVWDLDTHGWGIGDSHTPFDKLLHALARDRAELAAAARDQRDRSLSELSALGYGDLPVQPIHGDFAGEHLLFYRGELSGVLDFDLAHVDARVSDIAWSIISECSEPPDETAIDPDLAAAFVDGYADESPLTAQELRLIVPLVRAQDLMILGDTLRQWAMPGGGAQQMHRIERRIQRRLPQLDERATAIAAAVLTAGG